MADNERSGELGVTHHAIRRTKVSSPPSRGRALRALRSMSPSRSPFHVPIQAKYVEINHFPEVIELIAEIAQSLSTHGIISDTSIRMESEILKIGEVVRSIQL